MTRNIRRFSVQRIYVEQRRQARQEGSPARQRWESLTNDDERRRCNTCPAIQNVSPRGSMLFYHLPRAYARGYLLNAPPALSNSAKAPWIAVDSRQEFFGKQHDFIHSLRQAQEKVDQALRGSGPERATQMLDLIQPKRMSATAPEVCVTSCGPTSQLGRCALSGKALK